ncbi:MAG TPA: pentapeptide repeat-containing protein [Candidatus Saccharimonadales bacterium]|nr:pentapeptide repeat-containing protein [Candidatus Saccharimonadales bacterium]
MKIAAPKLPVQLDDSTVAVMMNDGELEEVRLHDEEATNCNVAALDLNSVLIEKVQFIGAHFSRVTMRDVLARAGDFSSAHLDNGMVVRVEFVNCRMTGVDFSRTSLHDVVFRGCKLDMANFRFSDLRRVQFIDCTLVETDFMNAKLASVEFQSSVLEKTIFSQAVCKQVDLRSSQLVDIVGWRDLKGAVIDGAQLAMAAPYLAQELGLIVRNT